jgi:MFS family permease
MAAAPISVVLGSPLSSALLEMDGLLGLRGWQWMFIMEAIPAFLLGFVVLLGLGETPPTANERGGGARLEILVNFGLCHQKRIPKNLQKICDFHKRYSVFFEVRADLAWVARSMSGGGCCSPAIAHQTLT